MIDFAKMNSSEQLEYLKKLTEENEKLQAKAAGNSKVTMKIGEKGGLSVNIGSRYPVTLYKEQWNKLLANIDSVKAFIAENGHKMKDKE